MAPLKKIAQHRATQLFGLLLITGLISFTVIYFVTARKSNMGKFESGDFGANEAWKVQFKDEGTFQFHDHLNPKISVLMVAYIKDKQYKVG